MQGYSAKVELPGAKQNNPLATERNVGGAGAKLEEAKGRGAQSHRSHIFITSLFRQQAKVTESLTFHFLTLFRCISHSQHPRKLPTKYVVRNKKTKTTYICLPFAA